MWPVQLKSFLRSLLLVFTLTLITTNQKTVLVVAPEDEVFEIYCQLKLIQRL